ncbi:MAG: ribosome maturation factor [Saprospiraceae bacterium]|nr:ribosome maturation factor [Saprospiraceae bacterium]
MFPLFNFRYSVIEQRIEAELEGLFQEDTFQDCFLINIRFDPNRQKLEVFVDSDRGIDFDRCREISRFLEKAIETNGWLGETYTIEVSSPGAERPLLIPRQYPKHIGRTLDVKLKDGTELEGKLISVDTDGVTLERKVRILEGKRKKTITESPQVSFSEIEKAIVKLSFK